MYPFKRLQNIFFPENTSVEPWGWIHPGVMGACSCQVSTSSGRAKEVVKHEKNWMSLTLRIMRSQATAGFGDPRTPSPSFLEGPCWFLGNINEHARVAILHLQLIFQNNAWNTNMSPTSWHFWVDDFPFPKVDILVPWRVSPEFFTKNIPQKNTLASKACPCIPCVFCASKWHLEKKNALTMIPPGK